MPYRTVEGILHPDGSLTVSRDELPTHPVAVMITLLKSDDDEKSLARLGDYQQTLTDYEEQLARGEIQWQ